MENTNNIIVTFERSKYAIKQRGLRNPEDVIYKGKSNFITKEARNLLTEKQVAKLDEYAFVLVSEKGAHNG